MSTNVYQAPDSDLVSEVAKAPTFYIVSPKKFIILFICTLGLYQNYWFYKNWALYKQEFGGTMWPVMRGMFPIFFAHSLFKIMDKNLKGEGDKFLASPDIVAGSYVLCCIVGNFSEGLLTKLFNESVADVVGILTVPVVCWLLCRIQIFVNVACNDKEGLSNKRLTPLNYLWIALGLLLWFFLGLGLYDLLIGLPELGG